MSYGRTRRLAPEILKRVLAHRDRSCVVAGCDRPPIWQDRHHVIRWADGGETDPSNTLGLCRFHHRLHHEEGWRIEPDPDGGPEAAVTRPDGRPLSKVPRWRERSRRHDPYRACVLARLDADLAIAATAATARAAPP